jgi:hypothetical protein
MNTVLGVAKKYGDKNIKKKYELPSRNYVLRGFYAHTILQKC